MIIAQQQNDIVKSGLDNSKKATINQDKLSKLQYILTKGLYQDPIGSLINEWSANAIDSVIQSGKSLIENPVMVTIIDNRFTVKDTGLGISKEDFINVCMNYLTSTKENDNSVIGHFGLGMKVFMALDRSATFTLIKNNVECRFIAYQGDEFMEYDLIYEKETLEPNGVTCEISINGWLEKKEFKEKAVKRLSYYDNVVLTIDGIIINNTIVRSEDWQYSTTDPHSSMHICLKDVIYDLNFDQLGIPKIDIPIALRFDLNSGLTPVPSRESLIYNTATKELILNKIKTVSTWFVEKYNSQQKDEYELLEVFDRITNSDKYVTLGNEEFQINDLLQYSTVQPKELRIKGIDIMKPEFYYNKKNEYLDEYETLVDYNKGKWNIKYVKHNHGCNEILKNIKHIEIDKVPTGLVKKFLLKKYTDNRVLFIKKVNKRRLGNIKFSLHNANQLNYTYILSLNWDDKQNWRSKINEFNFVENQFKSKIINELNVENSNEYLNWLAKYKEEQKNNRKLGINRGNHKVLNKQQGQVTLAYAIPKSIGNGYKFDKTVKNINELHKQPKLTILFTEDQKELALAWKRIQDKWAICIIGKNEAKKIEGIHNHLTYKQFMDSQAFKRLTTSFLYEDVIDKFEDIFERDDIKLIQDLIKPFYEDINTLKQYNVKNGRFIRDNEICQMIKSTAKEFNLYDYNLHDVYLRTKANIEKYSFLSFIKHSNSFEDRERIKKLINQILYLNKTKHGLFEELEITVKQPETILEKQLEIV